MEELKPEEVTRDKYGAWTHSQLPNFGEGCSYQQIDAWAEGQGIHVAIRHMENEIDEEHPAWKAFFEGKSASFAEWEPEQPTPQSFLLSLHDTEDGPAVWWAMPGRKN